MKHAKHAILGALSALLVLTGTASAGLLDKLNEWKDSVNQKKDTDRQFRFYAVENCIKYYEKGDFWRARSYCGQAAKIKKELIYYAAVIYYKHKDVISALDFLQQAEQYLLEKLKQTEGEEKQKIKEQLTNVYLMFGETYEELFYKQDEKPDLVKKSVEYYRKALSLAEEIDNKIVIALAGRGLGNIYFEWSFFYYTWLSKAEEVAEKALKAIEEAKETHEFKKGDIQYAKVRIYNLLGLINHRKGDYKKAEEYYSKALSLAKKEYPELSTIYEYNLANLYESMKDYDKSIEYFRRAIENEKKKGKKAEIEDLAEWHERLARIYLDHKNDKEQAKEQFISALEYYEDLIKQVDEYKRMKLENKIKKLWEEIRKL